MQTIPSSLPNHFSLDINKFDLATQQQQQQQHQQLSLVILIPLLIICFHWLTFLINRLSNTNSTLATVAMEMVVMEAIMVTRATWVQ